MADRQAPFRGLFDTFAELSRIREHALRPGDVGPEGPSQGIAWIPTTDIFARGDDIVIRCELAGVSPDDVDVSLSRGTLTIWGERTGAPDEDASRFYVRERRYGPCRRSIELPEGVDRDSISATFQDGLLEITVAGAAAGPKPERIEIQSPRQGPVNVL